MTTESQALRNSAIKALAEVLSKKWQDCVVAEVADKMRLKRIEDSLIAPTQQQIAAIRKIRESVMAANLAVACNWPDQVGAVGPSIPPHQQRVLDEKKELDEKSSKLNAFFNTAVFGKLASEEQDRLHRQYELMMQYSAVLSERIAAF